VNSIGTHLLHFGSGFVHTGSTFRAYGFSVRCVADL
jgi:hypothetical protein